MAVAALWHVGQVDVTPIGGQVNPIQPKGVRELGDHGLTVPIYYLASLPVHLPSSQVDGLVAAHTAPDVPGQYVGPN